MGIKKADYVATNVDYKDDEYTGGIQVAKGNIQETLRKKIVDCKNNFLGIV